MKKYHFVDRSFCSVATASLKRLCSVDCNSSVDPILNVKLRLTFNGHNLKKVTYLSKRIAVHCSDWVRTFVVLDTLYQRRKKILEMMRAFLFEELNKKSGGEK